MSSSVLSTVLEYARQRKELLEFARTKSIECDADALTQHVTERDLRALFRSEERDSEWPVINEEIAQLSISESADSVNPGDRRAIYYVVRYLRPRAVLEIGTHLGGSTVHIAMALRRNQEDDPRRTYRMTTVDINDVNDPNTRPWISYGSSYSPREMVKRLGLAAQISFVTSDSLAHLSSTRERFDFIFLDGNHAPRAVYQEIPAALNVLEDNGAILLHDYFPKCEPLWSDGVVIQGPWLAVERLRSEGVRVRAIPFGRLPWHTKLGSAATSLALLVSDSP